MWLRLLSFLVPRGDRRDWLEEWTAELAATGQGMTYAWGALADAWHLARSAWPTDSLLPNARATFRSLARSRRFALLAGATLTLGLGATTAVFTVVDGVLLDPLPLTEPDRLVSFNHVAPGLGVDILGQSEATFLHYRDNVPALRSLTIMASNEVTVTTGTEPRRAVATQTSQEFFRTLDVQPVLGRGFAEEEDREGAEPVVVLGYGFWQDAMGGEGSVLGRSLRVQGIERRILGVMPEGFEFPEDTEIWLPVSLSLASPENDLEFLGVGRLQPDATIEAANAQMHDLLFRLADERPEQLAPRAILEDAGIDADVRSLKDLYVSSARRVLLVLLGTVAFVLIMACANVASLFLLRGEERIRERSIRVALGASEPALMIERLAESVILALIAGGLALPLAAFGVDAIVALAPAEMPRAAEVGVDGSVVAFVLVLSIVAGLLLGLVSSLSGRSGAAFPALRQGDRSATEGGSRHRVRNILTVAQVAMALVLLIGSGLMGRTFLAMRGTDPGFSSESRLVFRLSLPSADYPDDVAVRDFLERLTGSLESIAGVEQVAMDTGLPLTDYTSRTTMDPEDRPRAEGELGGVVDRRSVTPGYFTTMGIPLEGRELRWDDSETRSVVISRSLANEFWPDTEDVIGKRLRGSPPWEIVGVAGDVRRENLQTTPFPVVYFAPNEATRSLDVVVRSGVEPMSLVPAVGDALRSLDPRLPMANPRTFDSIVSESMSITSFALVLLGIAAAVAVLLGAVGVYGVISYVVRRRTREIGVRMALGATVPTVVRRLVGRGMALTATGLALGLLAAWGLGRVIASLLYGVDAADMATFAGTSFGLATVAFVACWIPARRAARIDPAEAFRAE